MFQDMAGFWVLASGLFFGGRCGAALLVAILGPALIVADHQWLRSPQSEGGSQ